VKGEPTPAEMEKTMPEIGARRLASGIIGGIKDAVGKAMDEMRLDVAGGITELTTEIREGGQMVRRALRDEAMGVRVELGTIVGNAQAAAEDAVTEAKKIAAEGNGHDAGDAPQQQGAT
jgi:uncharacterized protein YjbJ (UPF0337 family)